MKFVIYLFFLFTVYSFSQDNNIITQFARKGSLYDSVETKLRFTEFRKGKKCEVIEFVGILWGESFFKIKYEKWTGFVYSEDIVINDEIQELINQYIENKNREVEEREKQDKIKLEMVKQEIAMQKKERQENEIQEQEIAKLKQKRRHIIDSLQVIDRRKNCHYLQNEIDEFDNVSVVKTELIFVSEELMIQLYKKGQRKYVFFNLFDDLGCASSYSNDRSYVKVKLENNDIITFYHSWDIDCANFNLKGNLSSSEIIRLKKSPIKSMRFQGTKYYHDITRLDYKEFFIEKLKCLEI